MTRPLRVIRSAERDIEDAAGYDASHGSALVADAFLAAVQEILGRVGENPQIYPRLIDDARRVSVGRFPYGVWCRTHPEETVVFAVLHHRLDPATARGRAKGPMI